MLRGTKGKEAKRTFCFPVKFPVPRLHGSFARTETMPFNVNRQTVASRLTPSVPDTETVTE